MLNFRFATLEDKGIYYKWANEVAVRDSSFSKSAISYETHVNWFEKAVANPDTFLYLFYNENGMPVGQVRIEKDGSHAVIGVSVDLEFRGQKISSEMISTASEDFLIKFPKVEIIALIKLENIKSLKAFKSIGYIIDDDNYTYKGAKCFKLIYRKV